MTKATIPLNLNPATLIKRYKRFLADIHLPDGQEITIHCPNTGSMKNCGAAGDTIWYSTSDSPKRKYPHTWELTQNSSGDLICVNTQRANALLFREIEEKRLKTFSNYTKVLREVKYGENSRIDLLLQQEGLPDIYIEIKSCTLLESDGFGYFPDAVTLRGQKHLKELMAMVSMGHRAVLLFAVMHTGITQVKPAAHIDPKYAELLAEALDAGVEVIAYSAEISSNGFAISGPLPVII